MFKVFNKHNNEFIISKDKIQGDYHSFEYKNPLSVQKAILEFKKNQNVNIFNDEIEVIWNDFKSSFPISKTAGGLVRNLKGEFLFIFKDNKWDLPKGHIEQGESLEDCAIREVGEECGLDNLNIIRPLEPTYHIFREDNIYMLKTCYWFEIAYKGHNLELKPQIEERITKVAWVAKDKLNQILSKSYKSIHSLLYMI